MHYLEIKRQLIFVWKNPSWCWVGFFGTAYGSIYLDAKGCPLLDCLAFLFEDSKPDVLQLPVLVSVPWYSSVVRCTTTFGTTKSSIQIYKRNATRDITLALFVGDQFSRILWVIPLSSNLRLYERATKQ